MSKEGETPKTLGSYEKTGIDVLIVGTGLAGLTAALECHRKGHNVHILERNATINTAGEWFECCSVGSFLSDPNRGNQVTCTSWVFPPPNSSSTGLKCKFSCVSL